MHIFKQTKTVSVTAITGANGLHVVGWNSADYQCGGQRVYHSKFKALIKLYWILLSK